MRDPRVFLTWVRIHYPVTGRVGLCSGGPKVCLFFRTDASAPRLSGSVVRPGNLSASRAPARGFPPA